MRITCTAKSVIAILSAALTTNNASSAPAQQPLFLGSNAPPLMMLVMQRDHKLYYEAYNDASDLTGDGVPETGYQPDKLDYLGYFDSKICYTYSNNRFEPSSATPNKKCSNAWSGDFLNYLTTSRMDALRKVLYGGTRHTDTESETVLERSFIPQDAHSWGKEYTSIATNGYDISEYSPLSKPSGAKRHLFANLTISGSSLPLLRVRTDSTNRIWEWMSIERPVGGDKCINQDTNCTGSLTDFTVRVKVCVPGLLDKNCTRYPSGQYKPTGLLHKYGETESMYFGLLTGSYAKNLQGGVVRKNVGKFTDEVNANNGTFKITNANAEGIVNTINRLRVTGFKPSHDYNCGWITNRPANNGECQMWGNPLAEMMYEATRYFAGGNPTADFLVAENSGEENGLGLPVIGNASKPWKDPYKPTSETGGGALWCAKPFMLAISDTYPSYDSDALPGSSFSSFSDSKLSLNVSTEAQKIWAAEGLAAGSYFIGQSGSDFDSAPTAKSVKDLGSIRGLVPEEPTKQGSYYAAAVAQWARTNDVSTTARGTQNIQTFSVALASPLPRIIIKTKSGKAITVIPFAKSPKGEGDYSISPVRNNFQPTNQLVDFYIDYIKNTDASNKDTTVNGGRPEYKFRINFEDVEQGADHDMDAISTYTVSLNSDEETVSISVSSDYAAGGIVQHMGYVISGTTDDGVHLVVRDKDTSESSDPDYFLDSPNTAGAALPLTSTRKFTAGTSNANFIPQNPLWYAAKYGGFNDKNDSNSLNDSAEWDANKDGTPDNYYLVTNPSKLYEQLDAAFTEVIKRSASATLLALNSTRLNSETRVYQASFDSKNWTGELSAFEVNKDGALGKEVWSASKNIPAPTSRKIFSWKMEKPNSTSPFIAAGMTFDYANLTSSQKIALGRAPHLTGTQTQEQQEALIGYIKGDQTNEPAYRKRDGLLGDIVNSDPTYGGAVDFGYDRLPITDGGGSKYLAYLKSKKSSPQMIYFGANDGMLHGLDATSGDEKFSFIPNEAISKLKELANVNYASNHKYFVDGPLHYGDAYITTGNASSWKSYLVGSMGAGGKSLFLLDVTNPNSFGATNIKWEFTNSALGYTLNRPIIAKMANGRWAVITGNGPDSSSGAKLFVIYLDPTLTDTGGWDSGTDYCSISTIDDATTNPNDNGLGSVTVVLSDSGKALYAYAGDLQGQVWRFNLSNTSGNCPSDWNADKVFTATSNAGAAQPITAAPQVELGPDNSLLVVFGTGKHYELSDPSDKAVQSLYGIRDPLTRSPNIERNAETLVQQEITVQSTSTFKSDDDKAAFAKDVRTVSQKPVDYTTKKGWYLDLGTPTTSDAPAKLVAEGERVLSTPLLNGKNAIFTTYVPGKDSCDGGGSSWLFALNYLNGNGQTEPFFDMNNNGIFNAKDKLGNVSPSAIRYGFGGAPAITGNGNDKFILKPSDGSVIPTRIKGRRLMSSWRQIK